MGYSPWGRKESDTTERFHFHRVGFPVAQTIKNLPAVQETWIQSLGWEDRLEKGMATYSSILPGEFHGQWSLASYSPCGHKEWNMTKVSNTVTCSNTNSAIS